MKILVTGSSGMLGTALCEVLSAEHKLVGIDLKNSQVKTFDPRTFYKCDLTDGGCFREILDKESPDIVIHSAAWTDVDGCELDPEKAERANVAATDNVASAAAAENCSVIFISTDFVFNGHKTTAYSEEDKVDPINVYGRTKQAAEEKIKEKLDKYTIVRTSWLYGGNGSNFVDAIIRRLNVEEKIRVVDDQVGSPTYTNDLADALAKLIRLSGKIEKEIFHIANSGRCSWYDFARQVIDGVDKGQGIEIEPITSGELKRPAPRPRFSVLNIGKFQKTTGCTIRPWQDALEEYLKNRIA